MKKVIFIFASLTLLLGMSCREEQKSEKVIIEKQVESPKAEESDGTSLSIGNDGIEFSTKDGDKKTEVDINSK